MVSTRFIFGKRLLSARLSELTLSGQMVGEPFGLEERILYDF